MPQDSLARAKSKRRATKRIAEKKAKAAGTAKTRTRKRKAKN